MGAMQNLAPGDEVIFQTPDGETAEGTFVRMGERDEEIEIPIPGGGKRMGRSAFVKLEDGSELQVAAFKLRPV